MNRMEFMQILESKLSDISMGERKEALEYYNDYFNDAGVENEQEVMDSLGSPEQVAQSIKADLSGKQNGEFTENGYKQEGAPYHPPIKFQYEENQEDAKQQNKQQDRKTNQDSSILKIILVAVICLFAAPIILPVFAAVVATAFGLLVGLLGIIFGIAVAGFALVLAGLICIVVGFVRIFMSPLAGAFALGIGFLILGIGLLLSMFMIWAGIKIFPPCIRGIVNIIRIPFDKIRGGKHE